MFTLGPRGTTLSPLHFPRYVSMTMRTVSVKTVACREVFRKYNIPPLASESVLLLLSFVVDNLEKFHKNSDVHNWNTRCKHGLHMPNSNPIKCKKGVHYNV